MFSLKKVSWLYSEQWKLKQKTNGTWVHSKSLTQFGMPDWFYRKTKKEKIPTIWPPYIKTVAAQNGNEFLHSVRTQDLLTSVNY